MITLIEIFIISLFCNGLYKVTESGYLLDFVDKWAKKVMPDWLYTPFLGCPYCMASLWGSVIYWALEYSWFGMVTRGTIICWPIVCVACVYLNGYLHETLEAIKKQNQEPKT